MPPELLSPQAMDEIHGPVKAYRNLRYSNDTIYSVKQSRLIGYVRELCLQDVRFVIRRSEQERAVFRHERNVHAWATGTIVPIPLDTEWRRVRYNCFKWSEFVDAATESPIFAARFVMLDERGCFYVPEAHA